MSCQVTDKDIESETQAQNEKEKENTPSISGNEKAPVQTQAPHADIAQNNLPVKSTPVMGSTQQSSTLPTVTLSKSPPTINRPTDIAISSVSTSGTTPPVIYRTLKSPVTSGAPLLPQRVALKSSPPSLPVQQSVTAAKPSPGNVSSVVSSSEARYVVRPFQKILNKFITLLINVFWAKLNTTFGFHFKILGRLMTNAMCMLLTMYLVILYFS